MLQIFRRPIVLVRADRLSDREMEKALTEAPDSHPILRAFMQLLDDFEEEAHEKQDEDLHVPRALEAHTGGAKYIRAIRNNVLARRAAAAKKRLALTKGAKVTT